VSYFVAETGIRTSLREKLNNIPDFERSLSRIVLNRFKPPDLSALKDALHHAMHIRDILETLEKPDLLEKISQNLSNHGIFFGYWMRYLRMNCLSSRIGASDDLARGRSTFMVEMVETAAILNQATPNSLVIFDEVGRGTSTFDGLSIAWSSLEYLHNINKCRTLFATHYHELTQLSETLPALGCYTVNVKDWEDTIIFLHEVIKGSADRSYGIHVAQLAGLPKQAIDRAQQILGLLEGKEKLKEGDHMIDLPLFKEKLSLAKENVIPEQSVVNTILGNIVLDELTPIKAFDILVNLVGKAKEVI
jgi:DNA mismatch repair ATPase MutS